MNKAKYKRRLISDEEVIVVLDTSPVRELAHSETPAWVGTFAAMAKDGYSFSLADGAAAELLVQIRSERISREGHRQMILCLERFLNPRFPVLPGKIDLEAMIGVKEWEHLLHEIPFLSSEAWRQLLDPFAPAFHLGPPLDEILDEERQDWVISTRDMAKTAFFMGIDLSLSDPDFVAEMLAPSVGNSLSTDDTLDPPMSDRMHLELRYRLRQMARSVQAKKPYNPINKKNKNDGIDVDIYKYFILPAYVVATDSGFFGSLQTIDSFQKDWFFRPEELASRWLAGARPTPVWPS